MDEDNKKRSYRRQFRTDARGTFPGHGGNTGGRPRGAQGVFSEQMIYDFAADWREHGPGVLVAVRKENPVAYLTIAAKLVPREMLLQLARPVEQLSDAELAARPRPSAT